MVRYKLIFSLILFGCFYSCSNYVPNRIKKNFSYCYQSDLNLSQSKIKFNGYYSYAEIFERTHYNINTGKKELSVLDTSYINIMFFPDGVFVLGFKGIDCGNCDIESNNEFLKNVSIHNQYMKDRFFNDFFWGIYKINDDTIKAQFVNRQSWYNPYWVCYEKVYLINEQNIIIPLYTKDMLYNDSFKKENPNNYIFIETNFEIESDCWLKKEKWFWCNEKEWKGYMESLKLKKKGKKD